MRFLWLCLLAIVICLSLATKSPARDFAGFGRLLVNDSFATITDDRWRAGSSVFSAVWARGSLTRGAASDAAPLRFGDVLEFRLRGEIISPANIVKPATLDRPYATALSFGLHTHFDLRGFEVSLGTDLVLTGPQTGIDDFQTDFHNLLGIAPPSALTLSGQIGDAVYGAAVLEVARRVDLSPRLTLRPFIEVQGGVETLARAGADLHVGLLARDELLLREGTTGHRYRLRPDTAPGWAAVIGADITYVDESVFLPASSGVTLTDTRTRVRAGVHWQNSRVNVFYGLTWLSKEFEAQPESQLVGALRIGIKF